ncbi:hypothetical protein GTP46_00890 [Duganella sp. FT135W]|uniref:PEP-CTERM sorting domain-containing protein n=1 Tax=Duganella flavida TaxID=2692175 RepID=A0A6L8K5H7_9BURK|nr:hypothetical protein [Duganella flavida]MYM21204.1 hypothetical protein [Duganella flavida]
MKRLTSLVLLSAALGAGPASAMRAHDIVDAGQRGKITLASELPPAAVIVPQALDARAAPAAGDEAQLPTPEQQAKASAETPVVSAVPEPSGLTMLACGALLLLFAPYGRDDDDKIMPELTERPDSSL